MSIKSYHLKIFLMTLTAIFIIVSLQYIGVKAPRIELKDTILPRIQEKANNFKLKKQTMLVAKSYAASYDYPLSSYAVVDFESGEILAEKAISQKLPIASLTKIMTAVVALDLASPGSIFTISKTATHQIPTNLGMIAGQKMTLEELLHALLMTSANDAAQVIKEGVNQKYHDNIFIDAMNKKATLLGLTHTHFDNPSGFDSDQNYSSATDLAVLSHYALSNYPLIQTIVKKDYQLLPKNENHKQFDLYNWNGLLDVYPGVMGLKIGNTENAGNTTIVVAERNGKKILVVELGADGFLQRDLLAGQLLDNGFEKVLNLKPIAVNEAQLRAKYSTWKYWN